MVNEMTVISSIPSSPQSISIEPGSASAISTDPAMKALLSSSAPIVGPTLEPSNVYNSAASYDESQRQNTKKAQIAQDKAATMRKKSKMSKQKIDRKKIIKKKTTAVEDMVGFFNTKKVNKSFGTPNHAIKIVMRKKTNTGIDLNKIISAVSLKKRKVK